MSCDVLLVDILSSMRVATGLIYPSNVVAQVTGYLEQEDISFEVMFAIVQDDGQIDIVKNNEVFSEQFDQEILSLAPQIVAFFPETELIPQALLIHERIKTAFPLIVSCAGTNTAIARPDEYIKLGFDYICGQDVFISFTRIAMDVLDGKRPEKKIISIPRQQNHLNDLPFISKKFFSSVKPRWCFPNGDILTFGLINDSFGCTGGCPHCPFSDFWGTDWIAMDAERMFAEMKHQIEFMGVDTFLFAGINFFPNDPGKTGACALPHKKALERMEKLETLIDEHGYDVKYMSAMRPDTINYLADINPEFLDRFLQRYRVGFIGLESLSETVMHGLNRKTSPDMTRRAVEILDNKNIMIIASFIVGSLAETHETLEETFRFIKEELPPTSIPILNIMTPYPGTEFYAEMEQKGLLLRKDLHLFNGKNLLFKHPVFQPGELEDLVQKFYTQFFMQNFDAE